MDSHHTFAANLQNLDKIYLLDKTGILSIFNNKVWKSYGLLYLAERDKLSNFIRTNCALSEKNTNNFCKHE